MATKRISRNALRNIWLVPITFFIMIYFYFVQYTVTSVFIWMIPSIMIITDLYARSTQGEKDPLLEFTRQVSGDNFFQTAEIKVELVIENKGEGTFRGEVVDLLPKNSILITGSNKNIIFVPPAESATISYSFTFNIRGKYEIGPINMMYHSKNEVYTYVDQVNLVNHFTIIPLPADVSAYPTLVKHLRAIGGPFPSKLNGEGWSFSGIRDYYSNDPMKWVNWKATAKLGKLQVNEFALQRSTKVLIVLDIADESSEVLERSIEVALGLTEYLLTSSCKVGIITLGKYVTYFPPTSSRKKMVGISHLLTNVQVGKIDNRQLFRKRLDNIVNKLQSDNEVIIFSSMSDKNLVDVLVDTFPLVGNTTIFTPDFTRLYNVHGEGKTGQSVISSLFYFNRMITTDKIIRKGVKVRYWNPILGLNKSVKIQGRF